VEHYYPWYKSRISRWDHVRDFGLGILVSKAGGWRVSWPESRHLPTPPPTWSLAPFAQDGSGPTQFRLRSAQACSPLSLEMVHFCWGAWKAPLSSKGSQICSRRFTIPVFWVGCLFFNKSSLFLVATKVWWSASSRVTVLTYSPRFLPCLQPLLSAIPSPLYNYISLYLYILGYRLLLFLAFFFNLESS